MPLVLMQRALAAGPAAPGAVRRPSGSSSSAQSPPPPPPCLLSSSPFASTSRQRPFSAPPHAVPPASVSAARSASPLAPLTFIPGTLQHRRSGGSSGGGGRSSRPAASASAGAATVADAALAAAPTLTVAPPPSIDEETHHQVRRRRQLADDDPPPPPEFLEKYMLGELLGKGASASVRVAVDRGTGLLAAAKLLRRRVGAANKRRDRTAALSAEITACRRLQAARHAARLLDVFESDETVVIVSELLPGGDLSDLLAHSSAGRLDEHEAAAASLAALQFVADAHDLGFVVGDVKPQNFALRRLYPSARHLADPIAHPSKGVLDVAAIDFGCCVNFSALAAARASGGAAKSPSSSPASSSDEDEVCVVLPSMPQQGGGACGGSNGASASSSPPRSPSSSPLPSPSSLSPLISGTPIYMAPEVLKGCASPSSDVWACGVMLYELLTGQFPFWREPAADVAALGARAVTEAINHGPVLFPRDPFATSAQGPGTPGLDPGVQDLLLGMLQRDPSRRLTAKAAAEHPWFAEVLRAGDGA